MAHMSFHGREFYSRPEKPSAGYQLLPFRFDRWEDGRYFVSNEVGEFLVLPEQAFRSFVGKTLTPGTPAYFDLKAKQFLIDGSSSAHLDLLASKYRTKKSFLDGFTKLHIFVTTLRCNQSCPYCQVSRQVEGASAAAFDMSEEVLERSVRLMLSSPSPRVTMEFQGGEPLVNFDLVREGVRIAQDLNRTVQKHIDYVICTNLSLLEDDHLDFCGEHGIALSTSLDGPAVLHDHNRPMGRGRPSHAVVTRNIRRAQEALGKQAVSALMTTTRESLRYPTEIIDEYLRLDMGSIFLRELSPYGFAIRSGGSIGYSSDQFLTFYKRALAHVSRRQP